MCVINHFPCIVRIISTIKCCIKKIMIVLSYQKMMKNEKSFFFGTIQLQCDYKCFFPQKWTQIRVRWSHMNPNICVPSFCTKLYYISTHVIVRNTRAHYLFKNTGCCFFALYFFIYAHYTYVFFWFLFILIWKRKKKYITCQCFFLVD